MIAPFRLAIRAEGSMVNAYLARWGTMEGAHLLASVARACCDADPAVFEAFKAMAKVALQAAMKSVSDIPVDFAGEQPAPEHEKAGRA